TNPIPSNGATGVSTDPMLNVDVSDPDGGTLVVYFYDGLGTLIGTNSSVSSGEIASFSWLGLSGNTNYEWYVIVSDGISNTTSSTWNFTTILPEPEPDPDPEPDSLNITIPDAFTSWEVDTTHNIQWNSTGTISNVTIDLYRNGTFVATLAASTPNYGNYSWTLSSLLINSTLYHIRISDVLNSSIFNESAYFEIVNPIAGDDGTSGDDGTPGDDSMILIIIIVASVSSVAILAGLSAILLKKRLRKY
ncbi:hypothetical protein LCGC14_1780620, partial [marine sediment metagenome]